MSWIGSAMSRVMGNKPIGKGTFIWAKNPSTGDSLATLATTLESLIPGSSASSSGSTITFRSAATGEVKYTVMPKADGWELTLEDGLVALINWGDDSDPFEGTGATVRPTKPTEGGYRRRRKSRKGSRKAHRKSRRSHRKAHRKSRRQH